MVLTASFRVICWPFAGDYPGGMIPRDGLGSAVVRVNGMMSTRVGCRRGPMGNQRLRMTSTSMRFSWDGRRNADDMRFLYSEMKR
jgi:hypothetical protein